MKFHCIVTRVMCPCTIKCHRDAGRIAADGLSELVEHRHPGSVRTFRPLVAARPGRIGPHRVAAIPEGLGDLRVRVTVEGATNLERLGLGCEAFSVAAWSA